MILVDTSIWVVHVQRPNKVLDELLACLQICGHPFVIGELALGGFKQDFVYFVQKLPRAIVARDGEVLGLIERNHLYNRGIGYVDAHILTSARLTPDVKVWTLDLKMRAAAKDLDVLAALEG